MSKFTQGKWEHGTHSIKAVTPEETIGIAFVYKANSKEEAQANARLIAAAPELFSLSRRLLFYAYKEYKAVEEPYRYEIKAVIDEAEELFARILEEEKEA